MVGVAQAATGVATAVRSETLIDASAVDYLILVVYFAFVLGIGLIARRSISDSIDFFLSGRSLPAWVTGLASSPRTSAPSRSWG
jgi:SSS family solute:Na+ symporter